MPRDYLHNHAQFADLIRIVAAEQGIDPALVEKDYWIMHGLYGQQLGLAFELKGGTSLSKGFGKNQTKPAHIKSRADFYEWLTKTIRIDGMCRSSATRPSTIRIC